MPKPPGRRRLGRKPPPDAAAVKVAVALVESRILDRLDAACAAGRVRVRRGGSPADPVELTEGQLVALLRVIAPGHFAPPAEAPPTATAPGSAGRVAVYAARVRNGQAVFSRGDAGGRAG